VREKAVIIAKGEFIFVHQFAQKEKAKEKKVLLRAFL